MKAWNTGQKLQQIEFCVMKTAKDSGIQWMKFMVHHNSLIFDKHM